MVKVLMTACGALALLTTAGQAQGVIVGPGGFEIQREPSWGRRTVERNWDGDRTSTVIERRGYGRGCRTVIVRRETEDGDMVTRRIRRCD